MKFVNHNRHRVYVDDPERGLVRVAAGQEVDATGKFADNLEETAGVLRKGSDEEKARAKQREAENANLENATVPPGVGPDGDVVENPDESGTVTTADVPKSGGGSRKSTSKRSSAKKGS